MRKFAKSNGARNTTDCLELVRRLSDIGVYILFEKENINTGDMDSELILTVLSGLAESESFSISENNKWSVKHRFQNGTFKLSCPPYGFDCIDGSLVPNQQSEVVKRIFAETLAGAGTGVIASGLSADGIKPRRGVKWASCTIKGILVNEKYVGDVLMQKTFTGDNYKKHNNCGERDQYYLSDVHEAIIDRDEFERVGLLIAQRGKEKGIIKDTTKYNNRYAFSGKIVCSECDGTFKRRTHSQNKNQKYTAWCCSTHIDDSASCSMLFIRETQIQSAFVTLMNKLYAGRNIVLKPLIQSLKSLDTNNLLEKVTRLENLIEENIERRNVLSTLSAKGYIDAAIFNKQNNELKTEATNLKEQKSAITLAVSEEQSALSKSEKLFRHLNKTGPVEHFNKDLFLEFVEKVVVFSPTEIGFKLYCGICLKEEVKR